MATCLAGNAERAISSTRQHMPCQEDDDEGESLQPGPESCGAKKINEMMQQPTHLQKAISLKQMNILFCSR